jgi:hypothetical protein
MLLLLQLRIIILLLLVLILRMIPLSLLLVLILLLLKWMVVEKLDTVAAALAATASKYIHNPHLTFTFINE